jgi:hypothetical protein
MSATASSIASRCDTFHPVGRGAPDFPALPGTGTEPAPLSEMRLGVESFIRIEDFDSGDWGLISPSRS